MITATLLLGAVARAHVPVIYVTGPEEDWCGVINAAIGNDVILLTPGTYQGPCDVVAQVSNVDGELTSIAAFDPADPPVLLPGAADYVLSLSGHRAILYELTFADLPANVDAVRVDAINEAWVDSSVFRRLPGTAVRVRGPVRDRFVVTDSDFAEVGVGVELGCDDGTCTVGAFETSENLFVDVGVGFALGRGVTGTSQDDVIVGTTTAVRVAGGGLVTLDGGLYEGSGPVIDIVDGPAVVRSTIVLGSTVGLRAAGDAVRDVALLGSTVLAGEGVALDLAGWGPGRGLRVVDTAIDEALPALDGVDLAGSVGCGAPGCFTDEAAWHLYPPEGSPLVGAGTTDPDLRSDWCGRARSDPPSAGALEGIAGYTMAPLEGVFKEQFDCGLVALDPGSTTTPPEPTTPPPTDTGSSPDRPRSRDDTDSRSCGCRTSPGAGVLLAVAIVGRRRRR